LRLVPMPQEWQKGSLLGGARPLGSRSPGHLLVRWGFIDSDRYLYNTDRL
jgi:hypothetical protein